MMPLVYYFYFYHAACTYLKCKNNHFLADKYIFILKKEEIINFLRYFCVMNWKQLISNKRLGQECRHTSMHDDRSEFKRDYDRLIFSAPFRRLQNKTQVFPLPGSVFVHNRLTHSLEVACVGMSLGNDVAQELKGIHPELEGTLFEEIGTIVSAACLAHDMGNPPFGHSGENAIQAFFREGRGHSLKGWVSADFWEDITHFEGNANAFRLLTHQFEGRRKGGFVMTYSVLASIVKYPYASGVANGCGKFGFFSTEKETFRAIAEELGIRRLSAAGEPEAYVRHPLVYLVEAADDICYEIMDIEDAHKLKILSFDDTMDLLLGFFEEEEQRRIWQRISEEKVSDANEQIVYARACAINKLESECVKAFVAHEAEILSGSFEGSLIKHIYERGRKAYKRCTETSKRRIYQSKPVLDIELSGFKIMATLMEVFVEAASDPDRFYSRQLIQRVSEQYDIKNEKLEDRVMAVIDYVSGMTDVFALDIYKKINGISLSVI